MGCLSEPSREQRPAEARRAIKVPLVIIKIGAGNGFWKAALRITPYFQRVGFGRRPKSAAFRRLPASGMLGSHPNPASARRRYFVASFLDPLIAFVSAHPWLAYPTLFLAALLEAVPVLGSFVPGSTIILALSALVPGGELQLGPRAGGRDCRRRCSAMARPSGSAIAPSANPERLAAVELSRADRAERSVLSSLGHAGGVLRALRAAGTRLRAGHGGRARHAAAAVLRRQHSGDPAVGVRRMCCRACWRYPRCTQYAGIPHHEHDRQALLDTDGDRRRAGRRAGHLDHPPHGAAVRHDRLAAGLRPGAGPI